MSVLILGGAGYIGSHTSHQLIKDGEDVIIVDNLQTDHIEAAKESTKEEIKVIIGERRAGDPAKLVASSQRAKEILGC